MSISDIMAGLKKDYLVSMPYKIQEIQKRTHEKDKKEVINLFHQIKGSGQTYGFAEITQIAEKAEHALSKSKDWTKEALDYCQDLEKIYQKESSQAA